MFDELDGFLIPILFLDLLLIHSEVDGNVRDTDKVRSYCLQYSWLAIRWVIE